MGRVRTGATSLVLLLSAAVSIAAAVKTAFTALPVSDRQLQAQWTSRLTAGDLRQVPLAEQLRIVRDLERDFRDGVVWPSVRNLAEGSDREKFRENLARLMHVAVMNRVDQYFKLPAEDRGPYLDRQLDDLMAWPIFRREMLGEEHEGDNLHDLIAMAGYVGASLEQADPRQRSRLMRFLLDAKTHVERRGLASFRSTNEGSPR